MLTIGFDLDGVLMRNPFGGHVFPAMHRALRAAPALSGLSEADAKATVTRAVNERWGALMLAGDLVAAYDWDAIFHAVAAALGGAAVPGVADLVREGCGLPGVIGALPGAADALAAMREAGHRLVVVTNGYSYYQEPVLEALGLLGYFDLVVTPDRAGAAKPQAAAFAAAGGLDWFVGDTLVHDVLGARAAGVRAVWLDAELPPALAALPVRLRAGREDLTARVAEALGRSPYAKYHPEADVGSCTPDAVIRELAELPAALGREEQAGEAAQRQ